MSLENVLTVVTMGNLCFNAVRSVRSLTEHYQYLDTFGDAEQ